jgi:hypothetical protein
MTGKFSLLHHTADELRYVAKLLDAINQDHECIGVDSEAKIDIYWADVKMGVIMVPDGSEQFAYFPVAERGDTHEQKPNAVSALPSAHMGLPGGSRESQESPPANAG